MSTRDLSQRTRRVVRAAGITALVASALLLASIPRAVEVCDGALVEVPEPPLWRRTPKRYNDSRGIGEFGYASKTEITPGGVRAGAARVYDRDFCLSTGLSLERWLQLRPSDGLSDPELSIQRDAASDVFTISSEPWRPINIGTDDRSDDVHIVSFRRDVGTRLSVVSGEGLAVALSLAAAAALAGCGAWFGRRKSAAPNTTDRTLHIAGTSLFLALVAVAIAATIRAEMFLNERGGYDWIAR